MSGIAGILYLDGREAHPGLLEKMAGSLAHRSVDGSGIWHQGPLGLVSCKFATTPEACSSPQPLAHQGGRLVITADARIDNRSELAPLLGLSGEDAQRSDEYFILKAYEKWGHHCAEKLLGDFAFAIWDRSRNQIFCARDPLGVKPFYYYHSPSGFIFASEIKAILTLEEVPRKLNELCLLDYLLDDRQDKEITFFQGISRLPPAHFLLVSSEKFQIASYWSLDLAREINFHNDQEYAERFLELFTQAVRVRLRSAVPIGSALSGGLDSSAVSCVARDLLSQSGVNPLNVFSAVFSGLPQHELSLINEREYIEKVLSAGGFKPNFVDMGSVGPLADMDAVLRILDEPFSAPTLPIFQELYNAAFQQKIGVYLEGIDGDLVVSHGYERFIDLVRKFRWATWMREVQNVSRRSGLPSGDIIKRFTLQSLIPPSVYQAMRNLRGRRRLSWDILDYLSTDFVRQASIKIRIERFNQPKNSLPHSAKQAHFQELASGAVPLSLESMDKIASNRNIEVRYPFYDKRVVEFCLAVPADQKLSGGWPRFLFRNSLASIVPEEIRWRYSKADFRPFFKNGMLRFTGPLFGEMVSGKSANLKPYIDTERLSALYQRFYSGAFCTSAEVEFLYRSALLSKWIELG